MKAPRAEAAVRRALKLAPRDASLYVALARTLEAQQQELAAAQTLQEAVRLDPDELPAWEYLVALYLRQKQAVAAHTVLEEALVRHPRAPRLLWQQGDLHVAEHHLDRAAEMFERVLDGAPAIVAAWQRVNDPAADAVTLQRTVEREPDNVPARAMLGRLYLRQGLSSAAADVLQQALKRAPNDLLLHFLLGQARRQRGKNDAAIRSFRRAWERCPRTQR